MVKITEELIRKRSEHNEGIIGTLEELSLHQEDIEKIEHINNWCKNIEILYLQANLISKIENLNKLKALKYLNLAVNSIEIVENLERCESLEKLDLTLNFIGDLHSVGSLKNNTNLRQLYLTGNPCCDFTGYREFLIVLLPQLSTLDANDITITERLKAKLNFTARNADRIIREEEAKYKQFRIEQIQRVKHIQSQQINMEDEQFWKSSSENCPETRVEIARRSHKNKSSTTEESHQKQRSNRKIIRCFSKDGRPINVNQARLQFTFNDDNAERFQLNLEVYKHLDTNLIKIDLQPIYVHVEVKDKIFQFVLPEEIATDKSSAKRSQTTGHLLIDMPKAHYIHRNMKKQDVENVKKNQVKNTNDKDLNGNTILEINEHVDSLDFSKICEKSDSKYHCSDIPNLEYAY